MLYSRVFTCISGPWLLRQPVRLTLAKLMPRRMLLAPGRIQAARCRHRMANRFKLERCEVAARSVSPGPQTRHRKFITIGRSGAARERFPNIVFVEDLRPMAGTQRKTDPFQARGTFDTGQLQARTSTAWRSWMATGPREARRTALLDPAAMLEAKPCGTATTTRKSPKTT